MEVHLHDNAEAKFYDIHHNAVVYIDKLEGDYTPEMQEDNQDGLSKEQLNDIVNATKSLVGKSEGKTPKRKPKSKYNAPKRSDHTFTYVGLKECPERIMLLYKGLIHLGWIDKNTSEDHFKALFSGKELAFTIKWTRESIQLLWYLFKRLKDNCWITRPEGTTVWSIERNHFVNKQGREITDWSQQHVPEGKEVLEQIETLVNLMDPTDAIREKYNRQERRLDYSTNRRLSHEKSSQNEKSDWDD